LVTRDPDPQLLDAAAESVTNEFNERMSTSADTVSVRRYSFDHSNGRPRTSREKWSAQLNVPMLIPSLTK
jgi:hypothetical protein